MVEIIEKMELKIVNPERKGFPGVLKFWLPKYIAKNVAIQIKSRKDGEIQYE